MLWIGFARPSSERAPIAIESYSPQGDTEIEYVKVAELKDVPPDSLFHTKLDGKHLVLANVGGEIFALGGVCTYHGGPLDLGEIWNNYVICPWHGAMFDVQTGVAEYGLSPNKPVATYAVRIEGNDVRVGTKNE